MLYSGNKISLRQVMFLFLTIVCSPSVRLLPNYAARYGKQAGWLAPIVSFAIMIPIIYIYQSFYKKYKSESFTQIISDICGKIAGKTIVFIYIIWVTVLLGLYVRYYVERLVSTVLPNVNMLLFIIAMLVTVAIILRSGITIIARMNEIILPAILLIFISTVIFGLPEIRLNRLTPISYLDIVPVFKANIGVLGLWGYFSFVLIFSDVINNKEGIKKISFQTLLLLTFLTVLTIGMVIGMLGESLIEKMPIPYFSAVKQISIFGTIERIESFVVSFWVLSDFILIAVFTYTALNMTKNVLKLKDTKPFISIYLLFIYFLSLYISKNVFELQLFSDKILIPMNIVLGIIVPIIVFAIGKIRKKI